ncbi:RIO1 family protein [Pseudomassariella vexata]|uniref:Serine/threonine-protein kinase RIO2 n=1 Tax=Pseudomassariella vexata TaxID=1141098 RepID=A0A1Y2E1E0_9PEZI|nr:RIO1 family protein [Pseudomassariella vexata]ORY65309.1 RIO1 family protein [Pseudomassariella vexata]
MILDSKAMRHLTAEDWRVLAAVETGSKNHELVPTPIIERLSRLRGGVSGVHKSISALAKTGLIAKMKEAKYDGYRLTYGGLDYLALHQYASQNFVYSVGSRIGVGKESDIMIVADNKGTQKVLKIHRLGRISFRTVKANRDYLRRKNHNNGGGGSGWMYLSRLAAMKEYAFMQALREEGFPVPEPIAQSRHTIVMSLIDAFPLRQISHVGDPATLYGELMEMIMRLARHGLIHGDFNEFNILLKEETVTNNETTPPTETVKVIPILIDFPQMVSMEHQNAEMYFDRDVNCVKRFFERRFHFVGTQPGPFFKDAKKAMGQRGAKRLDALVEASGFTKKMLKDLEAAIRAQQAEAPEGGGSADEEAYEDEEDDDNDEEEQEADEGELEEEEPAATGSNAPDMARLSIGDQT